MAYVCRFNLLLTVIALALIATNVVCYPRGYPQKRATGAVPHINDLLMVNQRAQNLDTEAIANASLSSSDGLSQVVNLLESLVSNGQNTSLSSSRVVNLLESLVSNSQNLVEQQSQQFKNLTDTVDKVVFSMSVLQKGMRLAAGDCSDIAKQGPYSSGVYKITPWDDLGYEGAFRVYCDMTSDNEGWTVIQRRLNGSVDFFRGWEEYKIGFGDLDGEFWLGLDKLYRLTNKTKVNWQLKVELEDFEGNTAYADYDSFSIGDESTNFQLTLGAYSGTAGDSMSYHGNMMFSTKNRDNDIHSSNCAISYSGGWWYRDCHYVNLNGPYLESAKSSSVAITWKHWTNGYVALKKVQMKLKPVN